MNVSVIEIDVPGGAENAGPGAVHARVLVDIDGQQTWYSLRVEPFLLPESDARLVVAGPELLERFRSHQRTMHRIQQLVGRAVRQAPVHLPQLVAA